MTYVCTCVCIISVASTDCFMLRTYVLSLSWSSICLLSISISSHWSLPFPFPPSLIPPLPLSASPFSLQISSVKSATGLMCPSTEPVLTPSTRYGGRPSTMALTPSTQPWVPQWNTRTYVLYYVRTCVVRIIRWCITFVCVAEVESVRAILRMYMYEYVCTYVRTYVPTT